MSASDHTAPRATDAPAGQGRAPGRGPGRGPGQDADTSDASEGHDVPTGAVVVGVDGSTGARAALAWAVSEAVRRGRPLHLLCSREVYIGAAHLDSSVAWTNPELDAMDSSSTVVDEASEFVRGLAPDVPLTFSRPWGRPAGHLVEASREASMVVVGNRGQGRVASSVLGTVSLQTAAHAHGPVVVVREGQTRHPGGSMKITVGVDGSVDSVRAAHFAFDMAGPGGRVDLVLAWWLEMVDGVVVTTPDSPQWARVVGGHERTLERIVAEAGSAHPEVAAEMHVTRGRTEDVVLAATADADLLVVGSRGRGGFAGLLLGSVSQHMLGVSPCPVGVTARVRDR